MRRRITTAKREEIEKEQKLLDSTIVRPFETLEGLPISYNPPPNGRYEEVLKNPLTIKDSAVLYESLIRSRNTYTQHAPMFKLYWVKQTAYAKKLADMEKDKEATRERESRRRFAKATANSLESKTRTPVLSTDVNARDVMSKLCESSITMGPHEMEIRIFIAKDARSEKSRAFAEISRVSEYEAPPPVMAPGVPAPGMGPMGTPGMAPSAGAMGGPVGSSHPTNGSLGSASAPPDSVATSAPAAPIGSSVSNSATPASTPAASAPIPPASTPAPAAASSPVEKLSLIEKTGENQNKPQTGQSSGKPGDSRSSLSSSAKPAPTTQPKTPSSTSTPQASSNPPNSSSAPSTAAPPQPPPPRLQSINDLIMISNLNAIAKIDLSLNDLMKVVAQGSASVAQVNLFKKYIERANQMGPQPHHAEIYYSRNLPLPPNFPRPRNFVERRPPKPKIPNPLKLTAFQEKYLHNATLVFEFLENPNVRYVIPRDSICEVMEAENPPKDAEDDIEFRDILLSHVWIHNTDEVEDYERRLAEYNAEVKRKEEEEAQKNKEKEEAEKNGTALNLPAAAEERNLRIKKRPPPPKKKKTIDKPEEPPIRYTTFSFTLHNIPLRFVPIVMNSMKPLPQVQQRMEHILKNGTRVTSFYLWYQVDAHLDEKVAENLRNATVQEERRMIGIMPQNSGIDAKKRKPREQKNPKAKRSKEVTPAYTPYSLAQPAKQELTN